MISPTFANFMVELSDEFYVAMFDYNYDVRNKAWELSYGFGYF